MRLDFVFDGSPDCPLVRLYGFDAPQACELYSLVTRLADGSVAEVTLPEALTAEAESHCTLTLQVSAADQGIAQNKSGGTAFVCRLRCASWKTVAALIAPFCTNSTPGDYQWLDETSSISWLLSPGGSW